jgi:dephospho-CoA kinase
MNDEHRLAEATVIATVGLPGSGKSEAATVARELGVPVVTMGDVVREECRKRGLDPATDHGTVAKRLREEGGPAAIAEASLPAIESALEEAGTVLVDGVRSDAEVDRFETAFAEEFVLVSVEAPFETRARRLDLRGRDAGDEEGGESLAERDERERAFGMGTAMDRADVTVDNDRSLELFHDRIRDLLEPAVDRSTTPEDASGAADTGGGVDDGG